MHEDPYDEYAAAEESHLRSLTVAEADGDERAVEAALRPRTLDEVVGQQRVRDQLGLVRAGDLRYVGQGYELGVEFPQGTIDEAALADVWQAFQSQHQSEYGHFFPDSPVEIVNIRLTGTATMPKIGRPASPGAGSLAAAKLRVGSCSFRVDGRLARFDTPYYRREAIPANSPFEGPAVVLQHDTTTVVPPGWTATAETNSNLILKHGA